MLDSINGDVVVSEVVQPDEAKNVKGNISYRGTDYERTPESDSFEGEKKNKTGKIIGIIAGAVAAVAVILGAVCYSKGKGADGVEKKFGERIKDGWKELWHKGEKSTKNNVEENLERQAEDLNKDAKDTTKDLQNKVNESTGKPETINEGGNPEEVARTTEEAVHTTEEAVHTTEEATRTTEEVAHTTEEAVYTTEETVHTTEETVHTTEEAVHTTEEAVHATEVVKPEGVESRVVNTVATEVERSAEDIAKEAKGYQEKLLTRAKEIEEQVSKFSRAGAFPGEKSGDCYILKNNKDQVYCRINVRNNKVSCVTFYDPSKPGFETEQFYFDNDNIETIYKRVNQMEKIVYHTDKHELASMRDHYCKMKLSEGHFNDINQYTLEKVIFENETAHVTICDEIGADIGSAIIPLK